MTQEAKDLVLKFSDTVPLGSCMDVSYAVARHYENMEMIPLLTKGDNGTTFHFANYDKGTSEIVDFTEHRMLHNDDRVQVQRVDEISQRDMINVKFASKRKEEGHIWQMFIDATHMNEGFVDIGKMKDTGVYVAFETFIRNTISSNLLKSGIPTRTRTAS